MSDASWREVECDEDLAFRVEGGGRKLRWLVAVCLRPYRGQEYYQVLPSIIVVVVVVASMYEYIIGTRKDRPNKHHVEGMFFSPYHHTSQGQGYTASCRCSTGGEGGGVETEQQTPPSLIVTRGPPS